MKLQHMDPDFHMIVRRVDGESRRIMDSLGISLTEIAETNFQVVVDRFMALSDLCYEFDPSDWVIACDMTDIVFQRDAMEFLNTVPDDKRIVVASECIEFQYQWWAGPNMLQSFPEHWSTMKDKTLYNAGSIAGRAGDLAELACEIYEMCIKKPTAKGHDQAAMNILLQSDKYRDRTLFTRANDGWCYCMASTWMAREREKKWLNEPLCRFMGHVCVTENNTIPVMLHHYNRDKRIDLIVRRAIDEEYDAMASRGGRRELRAVLRKSLDAITKRIEEIRHRLDEEGEDWCR
jgi:hypothetical protein